MGASGVSLKLCHAGGARSKVPASPHINRDYISHLPRKHLKIPPEELDKVVGEMKVWASLLRLLPPRPNLR